jgi:3-isopropylmalate dehydrogenase
MIIRELTSGVYFGEPRGRHTNAQGEVEAFDTQRYTVPEIPPRLRRRLRAGAQAQEQGDVVGEGQRHAYRRAVARSGDRSCTRRSTSDVKLEHMYADALAMQLLRSPSQFDVIVTDNLFGDILSDEASMLTGSLGLLPSASLGAPDATGRRKALYEPIHGSAPDIAGKGLANPLAETLSYAMMLRYSFDLGKEADLVETAVENVLKAGYRTADLLAGGKTDGVKKVGTQEMGDAIVKELDRLA